MSAKYREALSSVTKDSVSAMVLSEPTLSQCAGSRYLLYALVVELRIKGLPCADSPPDGLVDDGENT